MIKQDVKTTCILILLCVPGLVCPRITLAQAPQVWDTAHSQTTIQRMDDVSWTKIFKDGAQDAQRLFSDRKIRSPLSILQDFVDLKTKTRLIVNLSAPPQNPPIKMGKDRQGRQQLEQAVKTRLDSVLSRLDTKEIRPTNRFKYMYGFSAEVSFKGLSQLIKTKQVLSVEKDGLLYPHTSQGISVMNALSPRSLYAGEGVSIAICDTGIDYTHPKLGSGTFPNSKVIGGYDTGDDDNNPMDLQGHGTACAGIAAGDIGAAQDYIGGVAHNARLYAVKISMGTGGSAYTSDMIEGWEWCIAHQNDDPLNPILVISTSFGGGRYMSACNSDSPAMTLAAANAVDAGITIFASSGNDGFCDAVAWPSCISPVISVGAVYDANFGNASFCVSENSCAEKYATTACSTGWYATDATAADRVTAYSNTASFLGVFAPSNNATTTDIVGPGGYSQGDYSDKFGGTSAACPYAAGAAACLQSAAKSIGADYLTPNDIRSILTGTGDLVIDEKAAVTKPRVNLMAAINFLTGPPIAQFSVSGQQICMENNTAAFQDTSIRSPYSWEWTFEPDLVAFLDGTGPDSQHPVVRFLSSGYYTVSLHVENAYGSDFLTRTDFIQVHDICQNIQLDLTTDDYGPETTWSLETAGNEPLYSGGPYANNQNYLENFLLPPGDYIFSIVDSWGDGICCAFGSGHYHLTNTDRNKLIISGGAFSFVEVTHFSVTPLPDVDEDGDTDGADLQQFMDAVAGHLVPDADMNKDGVIDKQDIKAFAKDFGN